MGRIFMPDDFYIGRWEQANIPIKFRGMRLAQYKHTGHASAIRAFNAAEKFVDTFTDHYVSAKRAAVGAIPDDRSNIGKGMMLFGRNGTRKSTLAASVLTDVQYLSPSYRVYYIRFSDWKRALTDTFTKEETERTVIARQMLKLTELSHLLVLDDIGQEHRTNSGFTESSLHELLRVRYEAARPTIVTTNIEPEFMHGIYGDSFESFRHDAFHTYPMLGPDTRKLKE